jgi:hypothetical protein
MERMLTLTEQLRELLIQIAALVRACGSRLPEIYGVGPIVTATIIGPRLRRAPLPHPAPLRDRQRDRTHPGLLGSPKPFALASGLFVAVEAADVG